MLKIICIVFALPYYGSFRCFLLSLSKMSALNFSKGHFFLFLLRFMNLMIIFNFLAIMRKNLLCLLTSSSSMCSLVPSLSSIFFAEFYELLIASKIFL